MLEAPASKAINGAVAGVLALFTVLCYAGVPDNAFMSEDYITAWAEWGQYLGWVFYPGGQALYRPLSHLFWYLGTETWGYRPAPYYLVVLLLHLLNGWLLYALAVRLTRSLPLALLAALLFLSLPTSVETVNWLSAASSQVVCASGYLLALLAWSKFRRNGNSLRFVKRNPALLCAAGLLIALLGSEVGLTWPLAALVVGCLLRGCLGGAAGEDQRFRSGCNSELRTAVLAELRRLTPFLALWTVFLAWRTYAVKGIGAYGAEIHLRFGGDLIQDLWSYLRFFTLPLAEWQPAAWTLGAIQSSNLTAFAAAALLILALWRVRGTLLLTLILLLPVLNIPALYRAYLAGAGFALLVAFFFGRCVLPSFGARHRNARTLAALVLALALVALQTAGAWNRNSIWEEGSVWARQILSGTRALVPEPADHSHFYFYELPTTWNEALVFIHGLREALQALYGNRTLAAYHVFPKPDPMRLKHGNDAWFEQIERDASQPQIFLIYRGPAEDQGSTLELVSRADFLQRMALDSGQAPASR